MANESDSLITKQQLQADLETFYNTYVKPYLNGATGPIDDSSTAANKTWSSTKINDYLSNSDFDYHEYSTTEKQVGKWIDNKIVYEKTITGTLGTTTTGTTLDEYFATNTTIVSVVSSYGYVKTSSGSCVPLYYWYYNSSGSGTAKYPYTSYIIYSNSTTTTANKNKIRIRNSNGSLSGCSFYITIRYTKS